MPAGPTVEFDKKPPTRDEIRRIVNKSRNKSTPGPNGIPFLLYKKCPNVLKWLHANLKLAWKNRHISDQWMIADEVYILLWPGKGSLMKTQTRILDNRLYYTRKIELHRKGKKSRTVRITPILICPLAAKSLSTNNGEKSPLW